MFDFRLKVFNTTAKRLSFTKAAAELYITQPAVTKHINEIEKHFNIMLFERNGTKIKLTPAGELLLQHTEKLFALHHDLELDMKGFGNKQEGILRVGASTTIAQYILPPVLAAFKKRYPNIQPELHIHNTEHIEASLEHDEIDLGVTEGSFKNTSFKYIPFLKDELVLVVREKHELLKKQSISLTELTQLPLLMREPGSGTLDVIANALAKHKMKLADLTIEMRMESTEAMKQYIANSDTAAFLSVYSVYNELKQGRFSIMDIKGLNINRDLFFIQKHGTEKQLQSVFMDFALHYNFR